MFSKQVRNWTQVVKNPLDAMKKLSKNKPQDAYENLVFSTAIASFVSATIFATTSPQNPSLALQSLVVFVATPIVILASWIIGALVCQTSARLLGGKATFEKLLVPYTYQEATVNLATAILLPLLILDPLVMKLGNLVLVCWAFFLTTEAIKNSHHLRLEESILAATPVLLLNTIILLATA